MKAQGCGRAGTAWPPAGHLIVAVSLFLAGVSARGQGVTDVWTAADGSWATNSNWSLGTPPSMMDTAWITNAGSKTVSVGSGVAAVAGNLRLDAPAGSTNTIRIDGGTLSIFPAGTVSLARGAVLHVSDGSFDSSMIQRMEAGGDGRADILVSGGSFTNLMLLALGYGSGGIGALGVEAGTAVFKTLRVGEASDAQGAATFWGGRMQVGTASQPGELSVGYGTGSRGLLSISGGTNELVTGSHFYVGNQASSTGIVLVTGGLLVMTNNVTAIGHGGSGTFTVEGGEVRVGGLNVGTGDGGDGRAILSGGTVVADAVSLATHANATGSLLLDGASLTANDLQVGVLGHGSMTVSNGTLSLTTMEVSTTPGSSSGRLDVEGGQGHVGLLWILPGGTAQVHNTQITFGEIRNNSSAFTYWAHLQGVSVGSVSNAGRFVQQDATMSFTGAVVNTGAWVTDPTTNTFTGAFRHEGAGYLAAQAGDRFIFTNGASSAGRFVNLSTNGAAWDTAGAAFRFDSTLGGTQDFLSAGLNRESVAPSTGARSAVTGLWSAATQSNFLLGTLQVAAGSTVRIGDAFSIGMGDFGADDGAVAALYVSNLVVEAGGHLVVGTNVEVYYLSGSGIDDSSVSLAAGGGSRGGEIHAFDSIPEPGTLVLLAAVAASFAFVRRRRARRPGAAP